MKFAHIADVHLGTRRETPYLYDGFLNFIDYMEMHPVDMIFITGDLFDHVPTREDIVFVDTQLARLEKTDILYVTGDFNKIKLFAEDFLLEMLDGHITEEAKDSANSLDFYDIGIAEIEIQ